MAQFLFSMMTTLASQGNPVFLRDEWLWDPFQMGSNQLSTMDEQQNQGENDNSPTELFLHYISFPIVLE